LIVGEVRDCSAVPKADKLLNLTIWDGKRERTILSGIHEWYEPEDLKGHKVVIVDNLAPRKMRGFISEGMVLSADTPDGGAQVIFVDDMTPGCKVR
ncbi:MAG: methionine--tRNA ligase, partial [Ruminococcaceae bacterium]|nr:methionine--tRNA ligase [Oscillospiraceae bacterium]